MLGQLRGVLAAGRVVREVEDGIHSVFPAAAGAAPHHYDRLAWGCLSYVSAGECYGDSRVV